MLQSKSAQTASHFINRRLAYRFTYTPHVQNRWSTISLERREDATEVNWLRGEAVSYPDGGQAFSEELILCAFMYKRGSKWFSAIKIKWRMCQRNADCQFDSNEGVQTHFYLIQPSCVAIYLYSLWFILFSNLNLFTHEQRTIRWPLTKWRNVEVTIGEETDKISEFARSWISEKEQIDSPVSKIKKGAIKVCTEKSDVTWNFHLWMEHRVDLSPRWKAIG